MGAHLEAGLREAALHAGVPLVINRVGSMLTPFFTTGPVDDAEGARRSNTTRYARFFQAMLDRGIYLPPSQFEAWFIACPHARRDRSHDSGGGGGFQGGWGGNGLWEANLQRQREQIMNCFVCACQGKVEVAVALCPQAASRLRKAGHRDNQRTVRTDRAVVVPLLNEQLCR